jgi:hypothetical protein
MKKIRDLEKVVELLNNGYEIHKNVYRYRTEIILFPVSDMKQPTYELTKHIFDTLNTVNRLQVVGESEHGTVYVYYK